MRNIPNIKRVGLSISAGLALPYAVLLVVSLLLVGMATDGSLQAALLGVAWSTIVGFEAGLLAIVLLGFAVAFAFIGAFGLIGSRPTGEPHTATPKGNASSPILRSRAFWLLAALFVLVPVGLLVLRTLAPGMSSMGGVVAHAQTQSGPAEAHNMGPMINGPYREAEPSFTADGRTMYFNCYNRDICVSRLLGRWEDGKWSPPERLASPISTEYEEVEPIINGAGDELYFTSIRPGGILKSTPFLLPFMDSLRLINVLVTENGGQPLFGGAGLSDVWLSHKANGEWSEPQNMNDVPGQPHINTPFDDHCLFLSADGNEAFWTSTQPGGFGSDDIWTSQRVNGKWTEPENLGPNVNGPGSEHTSIPSPDGQSLYVAATRSEGFGGEDVYATTRAADGKWRALVNLGPLVNGPGDDRCPAWTPDLKYFLFDSVRPEGFGARDIWWLYFQDVKGYPSATSGDHTVRDGLLPAAD